MKIFVVAMLFSAGKGMIFCTYLSLRFAFLKNGGGGEATSVRHTALCMQMGILSLEDMQIADAAKVLHNCCSTWHHQYPVFLTNLEGREGR
jgi:hypothetical protein